MSTLTSKLAQKIEGSNGKWGNMGEMTMTFKLNNKNKKDMITIIRIVIEDLLARISSEVSTWDKTVRLYDINENSLRASFQHKASVLDFFDINSSTNESIVGLHDKAVKCVEYSLEKHALFGQYEIGRRGKKICRKLYKKRESSLKFMTRCVKCMPNRQGSMKVALPLNSLIHHLKLRARKIRV
ncbi:unnamed protein product [Rhizophagus irregularis]|nr:unnamed protein product [Rhizophagus irregularis]